MEMIKTLYAKHYDIEQLFVSPTDQGHAGIARDRLYLILALRGKVKQVHNVKCIYRKVSHYIRRRVATRPSDYLVSNLQDVHMDALRTARVRKKRWNPYRATCRLTC